MFLSQVLRPRSHVWFRVFARIRRDWSSNTDSNSCCLSVFGFCVTFSSFFCKVLLVKIYLRPFYSKFSLFFGHVAYGRCVKRKLVSSLFLFSQPYLRNHPGLKEKLCCGDVTLIFRHTPSLADCDESILEKVESLNDSEPEVRPSSFLESPVPLSRRGPGMRKRWPPFARAKTPPAKRYGRL